MGTDPGFRRSPCLRSRQHRTSSPWEPVLPSILHRLLRLVSCGTLAALLLLPAMALAEDAGSPSETKKEPAASETAAQASILPPAAITEHSIRLASVDIHYSAKAATIALKDAS